MITEDYVSFETAKLLKKKEFDEECRAFYVKSKECEIELFLSDKSRNYNDDVYPRTSAPTLQMAAKWLREEHNLSIDNTCSIRGFYCSVVHIVKDKSGRIIDVEDSADWETPYCKTLEEAFDKALKFCLENLI